ncbi:hypothetical protein [Parachlamydia sp. AcF125]|uniref:hypothetical protein n=1 Tax=Parachlamydia sp. AcF125 TaxID=2795736 RepID=UPI001BC8CE2D|nr:hypothetical protein [Parachlamydia sp. AcF125]MBS4167698.1 hypothetical protein [Parachlamydia sp. AcF125]
MTTLIHRYPQGPLGLALAVFDMAHSFREVENLKKYAKLLEKNFKENSDSSPLARKKFCQIVFKNQAKGASLTAQKIVQSKFFQSMQTSHSFSLLHEKVLNLMGPEIVGNYLKENPLKEDEKQAFQEWVNKFLRCFTSETLIRDLQSSHMAEEEKAILMAKIARLLKAHANRNNPYDFFVPAKKFVSLIHVKSRATVELRRDYPLLIAANRCVLFCALDKREKGAVGNKWISFLESRGPKLFPFIVEYEEELGLVKVLDLNTQREFLTLLSWDIVEPFDDNVFLNGFMLDVFANFFLQDT